MQFTLLTAMTGFVIASSVVSAQWVAFYHEENVCGGDDLDAGASWKPNCDGACHSFINPHKQIAEWVKGGLINDGVDCEVYSESHECKGPSQKVSTDGHNDKCETLIQPARSARCYNGC
jgi:hypothetical protein